MTRAVAFQAVNMEELFPTFDKISATESGRIEVTGANNRQEFFGSFSYSLAGLTGGSVTRTSFYQGGSKVYEIEGGPFDATTVYTLLDSGDSSGLLAYIFQNADEIEGSNASDALQGLGGDDAISAGGGNDQLVGGAGDDTLDGGEGLDTAEYAQAMSSYILKQSSGGYVLTAREGDEGTDSIAAVETLQFADRTIDLSILDRAQGIDQQQLLNLTELYVASFGRAPDAEGLYFWASLLAEGVALETIAKSFFDQAEARQAYPDSLSEEGFVTQVYNNVLSRNPDSEGLAWWTGELESGAMGRDNLIMAILIAADSSSGSTLDSTTLANKAEAGFHFAATRGLNNTALADFDMANVTASTESKAAAIAAIDELYADVIAGSQQDFIIQLTGTTEPPSSL